MVQASWRALPHPPGSIFCSNARSQVLTDGHVYFTNEGAPRPSAEQALRSRFLAPVLHSNAATGRGSTPSTTDADDAAADAPAATGGGRLLGMFGRFQRRMQRLEDEAVQVVRRRTPRTPLMFLLNTQAFHKTADRSRGILSLKS